ncbi:MAG: beta-lactamase family protein [Oscillospiraceae bacterium]|nr:beta-lactamase family protein [Oscillospiraceae bacterium]
MARQKASRDYKLIEKIFDQLSSSVAIALLKDDRLAYEFYGGRKAALSEVSSESAKTGGLFRGFGGKGGRRAGARESAGGVGNARESAGNANARTSADGAIARTGADRANAREGASDANARTGADGAIARENAGGVNRTTRFNLGSASELFTGALAVKLMEFGELRLNDPVRRHVPEFAYEDVTVHHLMTHTSGLSSAELPLPDNYTARREYFRKLYEGLSQAHKPGAKYGYFNYNYAVLADLIERIAGQTLDELASVLIFMPLGMKHTTYNGASLRENQYVVPWNHMENRFMSEIHAKQPTGQSGVYTTALDLLRFGRMFLNEGEYEGQTVFLDSSIEFLFREVTGGKFMRTPVFMIKRKVDVFGCFSEKLSPEAVALTGDLGSILFIDPVQRIVGTALTNSTWVHALNQNYSNIVDILTSM